MEKFAIDLDKLLDDLESDDGPSGGTGGVRRDEARSDWKADANTLASSDAFVGELIDLSDADFGLAHVLKPSPIVTKPYGPTGAAMPPLLPHPSGGGNSSNGSISVAGGFVAHSAAKTSVEPRKPVRVPGPDGFTSSSSSILNGSSSIVNGNSVVNGSSSHIVNGSSSGILKGSSSGIVNGSSSVINGGNHGNRQTMLPRWPPAAEPGTYGRTPDGRWGGPLPQALPNEFNPLDSEPRFVSPPPPSAAAAPAEASGVVVLMRPAEEIMAAPELPTALPSSGMGLVAASGGIGSAHLWHQSAAESLGSGKGGSGGMPFGSWEETPEGSQTSSDSRGGFDRGPSDDDDDAWLAPACDETNSLLIANGVVRTVSSPPLPPQVVDASGFGTGGSHLNSAVAAAAAAPGAPLATPGAAAQQDGGTALTAAGRLLSLPSAPSADGSRAEAGVRGSAGGLLRFDDILIDEHDDDDDDAYLAGVPHAMTRLQQQPPVSFRNALLEANLMSDGLMRGPLGSGSDGGAGFSLTEGVASSSGNIGDFGSEDEEHVMLPTPQENALLQANLVLSAMAPGVGRGDGQLLLPHGGGREAGGRTSPELGDSIGASSRVSLENGYGWPPTTADRHFSNGMQALPVVAIAATTSSAAGVQPSTPQQVASLVSLLVDGSCTKRSGAPPGVEQSVHRGGAAWTEPVDAGNHAGIAAGGGSSPAKEPRRPSSLMGLSKVALDSAVSTATAATVAAPCSSPAVDSRMPSLASAHSREGEGRETADAAAASQANGSGASYAGSNAAESSMEQGSGSVDVAAMVPSCTREQGEGQEAVPGEPTAFTNGSDYDEQARGGSLGQAASGDPTGIGGSAEDAAAMAWDDLGVTKPTWMPDSEAPDCMACNTKFTFTKRRHHCRACGLIFCSSCCNMKSRLLYLDFKEARVCSKCHDQLAIGEMRQRELLGQQMNTGDVQQAGTAPRTAAAAVAQALQQPTGADDAAAADAASAAAAQAALPPVGVLRRSGSRSGQSKTVMFSDGIRPGGDLTHLDGSTADPARVAAAVAAAAAAASGVSVPAGHGVLPTRSKKKRSSVGDLIKPRTAFIIPKTGLPPVLLFTDNQSRDYVIDENPNSDLLYESMKDPSGEGNFAFVIHKDLHIYVKLVQLNCCAKKLCWCVTSKGLCTVGQEEVVVVLECAPDEKDFPTDLFYFYRMLYEQTFKGVGATELSFVLCTKETLRKPGDGFLGSKDHGGFLFVRPTFQCLQGLPLPPAPYLVAVLLDKWELPWAKVFPLRLALRLGAEYRYYPCPLVSIRGRKPVYGEIGHTIMNLLADFRNYQYTLGHVEGVTVHLQDKVTVISFPKNKYTEIYKILNSSNDYVLALGASFSSDADSHLVCVQTDEGVYQTQAINIQDKPRKVTGASFVVFSGALKTSTPGVVAKSSIVEDGLMVQILPEAMVELKNKIKNMQDHSIKCGGTQQQQGPADGSEEAVHIKWVDEYKKYNTGVISPIDGFPLDGVESLHVYGYSDLAGSGRRSIRWTEVYFLQNDELGNTPADPVDLSRLAETVAGSCMAAMSPHLETLKESGMVKVGLRVTLGADQVGYEIGSNGNKLPAHILSDLDGELVPVIHSTASTLSGGSLTVFELVFHVLE